MSETTAEKLVNAEMSLRCSSRALEAANSALARKDAEIATLRASLSKAREQAIEECAAIAKPIEHNGPWTDVEKQAFDIRSVIYDAIRALKGSTPTS